MKKKKNIIRAAAMLLTLGCAFTVLPVSAEVNWNKQEGAENAQGDQKKTGKTETTGEVPVYGAIGNLDEKFSMDIDGDGISDVTIPEADLIEVSVTPSVVVNVFFQKTSPGEEEAVTSTSAEGIIANKNTYNQLKVSLTGLEPEDDNAKTIQISDDLSTDPEAKLSLSIYAEDTIGNAFTKGTDSIGKEIISLANAAQTPPIPVSLGTITPKGGATPTGTYLFKANCASEFANKYKDQAITYKAVYKFTIQN